MQLKDTLASVFAPLGWMGVDLLSFMQILVCFVLGLVVKRTWTWSQRSIPSATLKNKKLEDEAAEHHSDKALAEELASDSTPMSTKKAGQVNAKERKQTRKAKEMANKSPSEGELVTSKPPESVPKAPLTTEGPLPEKKEQKAQKKAEKQRAKKREQEQHLQATETKKEEEMTEECKVEETKIEASTAYSPGPAEQDCLSEKWEEQHAKEERMSQELSEEKNEDEQNLDENSMAPALEAQTEHFQGGEHVDKPPTPPLDLTTLPNTKDADETPSTQVETDVQSESQKCIDSAQSTESDSETESLSENPQHDPLLLSDHEVQDETEALGLCEISTPELTPRNMNSPSMQWSSMNSHHASEDQLLQEVQPEVQVDGWVPVAIPVEYLQTANEGTTIHPACFFNGFWQNSRNETIMIEGAELKFENGPVWVMKEHNLNGFSVEVGGDVYHAEIAVGGQQLLWSDGDIWNCIGRLQHAPPPLWIQEQSELDSIMMAAEGYMPPASDLVCVDNMPAMLAAVPQANMESEDAEDDWEECWDWKKKGWCPRGENCEWKHSSPCCMWPADVPFVEDKQQMSAAGALYTNAVDLNDPILCEACA
mmetsp:Transcript_8802/g.16072  ORF Transcript_8802/g.16072 Transcript_8802/m.16072 type:complete len:595 (-) Transcript_8802:54-1838(-)